MKKHTIVIILFLLLFGNAWAQEKISRDQYIEQYKQLALRERDLCGIPASVTMAQALLESDNGNSRLAREGNNHFGIKCKSDWTGETIAHDDDALQECFRKYACTEDSFRDHSVFLENSTRYASLFKLAPTDYQGWAYGLKAAGYATNPLYATQLITIIEDNRLYLLDSDEEDIEVENTTVIVAPARDLSEMWSDDQPKIDIDNYSVSLRSVGSYPVYMNNGSEFILAREEDTYAGIAHTAGISEKRLRKFNDATPSQTLSTGDMVYVKTKLNRADNGKLIHIAEPGETLWDIAQLYGIRLRSLASMNLRDASAPVYEGQQIRLK